MIRLAFCLGALALSSVAACGAGEAARPGDPTYAGATGGETGGGAICHDVKADGTPLIVDWRPEDRGDVEVAMKRGVAFVHYDCNSIKLVPDCTAPGTYGFIGMTKKEQVINLANADEAKANLPFSGGTIGASLSRGDSIDIGLIMVGKRTTTFAQVTQADMTGRCAGATHFIRSATLGAYAMTTDTAGSVTTTAQIFSVGGSAGSTSTKKASSKDGDVASCASADPDATKPPSQCGAPLRVQLVAIDGPPTDGKTGAGALDCPAGMTAVNGKCTSVSAAAGPVCKDDDTDPAACAASCKSNVVASCTSWGDILIRKALAEKSRAYDADMAESFRRGCALSDEDECAMFAINTASGRGVPQDGPKALEIAASACRAGAAVGCTVIGGMYDKGIGVTADRAKGTQMYERACNAGDKLGCIGAAQAYGEGRPGIAVDRVKMTDYFDRACDAGEAWGCVNAGKSYEAGGGGVTPNRDLALGFYRRGCEKKNADACTAQKRLSGG